MSTPGPFHKQAAYKLFGTKGSLSSLKRVPRPLLRQASSCSNRQHHGGVIHKQGRRHEVGPTLCSTMENLDLVYQETSDSQSLHIPGRLNVVAIQARPDHSDRVVSPSRGLPNDLQQVSNRCICHDIIYLSYPMDTQDPPTDAAISLLGSNRFRQGKRCHMSLCLDRKEV